MDLWSKAASLKQRKIPCNTENYVPTIVPSLSSGSSSSSASSLTTTSSSQDSKQVESTQRPVRRRSKQDRRSARGNSDERDGQLGAERLGA